VNRLGLVVSGYFRFGSYDPHGFKAAIYRLHRDQSRPRPV